MEFPSKKWSPLSPMPLPRSHFGLATYAGKLYAFGGGGRDFQSLGQVHVYDPRTDRWNEARSMPTHRSGVVAVCLGRRIWVLGGGFRNPDGTFQFLRTVEIYDPETDRWEAGPDLIERHDAPAAAVQEGSVFLFGGHHPEARGGPLTDPATAFSESLEGPRAAWRELPLMPTPRFSLAAAAYQGKVLAMGGAAFRRGAFRNYPVVEAYDPVGRAWTRSSPKQLPWPGAGLGTCVVGERLYVMGGHNGEFIQAHAACYDPREQTWLELPSMLSPRAALGVAAVDNAIYALGGRGSDGKIPVNTLEVFSP